MLTIKISCWRDETRHILYVGPLDIQRPDHQIMDDSQTDNPKIRGKWTTWHQRIYAPSVMFPLSYFFFGSGSHNRPTVPPLNIAINLLEVVRSNWSYRQVWIPLPGPVPDAFMLHRGGLRRNYYPAKSHILYFLYHCIHHLSSVIYKTMGLNSIRYRICMYIHFHDKLFNKMYFFYKSTFQDMYILVVSYFSLEILNNCFHPKFLVVK